MLTKKKKSRQERESIDCIACGNKIVFAGNTCSKCQTPVEVSKAVTDRGTPFKLMSLLGSSGAGKTVYLGMLLDILSKGYGDLQGVPNNAFSVALQENTIAALENRRFPSKTPNEAEHWRWVHCEAYNRQKPKQVVDILTPDLAGESMAMELDQPGLFPAIEGAMRNSKCSLMLFDSESVRDNGRAEDLMGMKVASYLSTSQKIPNDRRAKQRIPLAIVFTKTDKCDEAAMDPEKFAATMMPGLAQLCQKKFTNYRFFAASVVGSWATMGDRNGMPTHVPLHTEPKGIVEPLEWIMQQF